MKNYYYLAVCEMGAVADELQAGYISEYEDEYFDDDYGENDD